MQYIVNHVHLELSSLCNARCTLCPRNFQGYPHNAGFPETNLSFKNFKRIFSISRLKRIHIAIINGNFGDAVMNPETPEIVAYMRRANPDMNIRLHTNGSARDREFWSALGRENITVLFALDGLADTHALYRQDTVFETVLKNAKTVMTSGGNAIWMANVFEHNRHQLPAMHAMAKELGFMWLEERYTQRDNGPAYNRHGQKMFVMKSDWQYPDQIDQQFIQTQVVKLNEDRERFADPGFKKIECWAQRQRSVYISADGHVFPCCWTGHFPDTYYNHTSVSLWNEELRKYVRNNHGPTVGLDAAIEWFDTFAQSWESDNQPMVCKRWCTKDDNGNLPSG